MPPFQPMLNFEHIIQSKNYIKSSKLSQKKYTTEPGKVHLNSDMETIRNHLIIKNIGQIQNVWKNNGDLKNSKHNLRYNFILRRCQPTKRTGICYLCLNKKLFVTEHQEGNLQNQKHEFISKFTNLSLWTTKPDHCLESVLVWSFFLVQIFFHIWTEYENLQSKCQYSLRMWSNIDQTRPTPNANNFYAVDLKILLCYLDIIVL